MVASLVAFMLGSVFTLTTGLIQERLKRRWDRQAELERRAEVAAQAILPLLDQIRDSLSASEDPLSGEADASGPAADQLEHLAIQISDKAIRQRFRDLASATKRTDTIAQWMGHGPGQVGWNVRVCGQNAVGALMRIESLQTPSIIDEYVSAIAESDGIYAEMIEREIAERRERSLRSPTAAELPEAT